MEFFQENYLWIILAIIIILMAIVGYIAEKNDFIKKSMKTEKPKKEKVDKKQKEEPIVIEDKGIDELLKNNIKKQEGQKNEEVIENTVLTDDIMQPLVTEETVNDGDIDQSLFAPLESQDNVTNNLDSNELNPIEVTQLQDIDINPEPLVVNEEDDIWKF